MGAINLAGVTPTERGLPDRSPPPRASRCACRGVGVAARGRRLRGYFRTEASGRLVLRVGGVPRGARSVTAWADGRAVAHRISQGLVVFSLPTRAGRAADWARHLALRTERDGPGRQHGRVVPREDECAGVAKRAQAVGGCCLRGEVVAEDREAVVVEAATRSG